MDRGALSGVDFRAAVVPVDSQTVSVIAGSIHEIRIECGTRSPASAGLSQFDDTGGHVDTVEVLGSIPGKAHR